MKNISIIVAVADGNAIGKDNSLLVHLPEDLKRFRRITTGHTVIMGKNTFFSLPAGPLKNRRNIVISDDPEDDFEGCIMARSVEEALEKSDPDDENFVIGGASIYRQFLPLADKLYLTRLHGNFEADTFFPELIPSEWEQLASENAAPDDRNDFVIEYIILQRKK